MKILVINCGSSSLKYQLINMVDESVLAKGLCERIGIDGVLNHTVPGKDKMVIKESMPDHKKAIQMVIDSLMSDEHGVIKNANEISAVGHRVVHGGEFFSDSVVINKEVKDKIKECCDLAPLHNPANLIGIQACEELMPGTPMVAVFDTAFHQTMEPKSYLYAIPYELYQEYKIRKYGFHGTSHKYVSERAATMLGKNIEDLKIITCHLGNGASICAVQNGKSIDTSMGFTPLEGLAMGTRAGNLDPAVVSFLIEKEGLDEKQINDLLNKKSGVLGISGISSDFRDIEMAMEEGHERAILAMDLFAYRVKKYIGEYAAAMGGVDAIVFTAGLGENDKNIRITATDTLGFLGVKVDPEKNNIRGQERDVSADDATTKVLVIPTNEELMIARETKMLV